MYDFFWMPIRLIASNQIFPIKLYLHKEQHNLNLKRNLFFILVFSD